MTDMLYKIPVGETICTAWEKVYGAKGSFWAAIGIMILIGLILGVVGMVSGDAKDVVQLIHSFVNFILQMGLVYMGIKRAQDLPLCYKDILTPFRFDVILKLVGLYILKILVLLPFILVMFIGFLLSREYMFIFGTLIGLAMIYISVRMFMAAGFVLDKATHPWQAIRLSFKVTRSNVLRLLGIFIIQAGILMLGVLTLGIGFIWVLPLGFILYGVVYQRLSANLTQV